MPEPTAPADPVASPPAAAPAEPWYQPFNLDPEAVKFVEDRKFADLPTTLKSHIEADRVARARNVLEKPDPAKLKEWKGWSDLGWVPDAAQYKLAAPKETRGYDYDQPLWEEVAKIAHDERVPLTAAQAMHDRILDYFGKRLMQTEAAGARALTDSETALRGAWKGDYDANIEVASRAARAFDVGAEDFGELGKVIGAPRLVKLFHAIGAKLGEAALVGGTGTGTAMTVGQAEAELRRLQGDPAWLKVFTDQRHPQNRDYVAQRDRLIAVIAKGRA